MTQHITSNKGKFKIKNDASQARIMTGIREWYYAHDEVKERIRDGKIKAFER